MIFMKFDANLGHLFYWIFFVKIKMLHILFHVNWKTFFTEALILKFKIQNKNYAESAKIFFWYTTD